MLTDEERQILNDILDIINQIRNNNQKLSEIDERVKIRAEKLTELGVDLFDKEKVGKSLNNDFSPCKEVISEGNSNIEKIKVYH